MAAAQFRPKQSPTKKQEADIDNRPATWKMQPLELKVPVRPIAQNRPNSGATRCRFRREPALPTSVPKGRHPQKTEQVTAGGATWTTGYPSYDCELFHSASTASPRSNTMHKDEHL